MAMVFATQGCAVFVRDRDHHRGYRYRYQDHNRSYEPGYRHSKPDPYYKPGKRY